MAILTVDSLLGCSSIPDFLGGSSDTPSNPSRMIFHNTTAPTNWVKDTTNDDKIMRVIGGANGTSLSPGGSLSYSSVFTSRSTTSSIGDSGFISGSTPSSTIPTSATTSGVSDQQGNTSSFTITSSHIAPHAHPYNLRGGIADSNVQAPQFIMVGSGSVASTTDSGTNTSPQQHSHPITMTHNHSISVSPHSHNFASPGHTHPVSSLSADFSVLYVDIIIATKS
jgi:hypothetical protein